MSKKNPPQNGIATRYGGVLFGLAQENNALKNVLTEVTRLHQCLIAEPREWSRVVSPTTPLRIQQQVVEKLATSLKLGNLMTDFLKVVCQNHRLQDLVFILENFMVRHKAAGGVVEGVVETATGLSQKDIKALHAILKQHLNKDVDLHQEVKESILGGIALRIGSLMIDASVKTQLNKLRQAMKG